jgi:site-specific DNA-methyltransferase (adenine-specific)
MKRYIALSAVHVASNRQRRIFPADKMQEFSDGINKRGLLHPIVLRVEGDNYVLVAGERRLRAVTDITDLGGQIRHDGELVPQGCIPYTLFTDLDPLAAEEAELEENLHREDLTWQEKASAIARIASLRSRQAQAAGEPPPSTADISLETKGSDEGVHHETTRRELIVAKHLDNPEVQAAKSVDEAFKILRKQEVQKKNLALGESVGRTFTADAHTVLNEDSLGYMASLPADSFDVILTDPPYGMNADEFGDSGGLAAGAHGYGDSADLFLSIMSELPALSFRLAKPQAHLYLFCDVGWFAFLREKFAEAGWSVFRTPLIWYKKSGMRAPWPEQGPQRKYETILYAVKGKRPVLKMLGDVLDYPPDANLGHAAQKPVALFQDLLSRSALPGQSVLDPFCGSGPVFAAAHALKVRATGIELDTASYAIAVKRIESLRAQAELDLSIGL